MSGHLREYFKVQQMMRCTNPTSEAPSRQQVYLSLCTKSANKKEAEFGEATMKDVKFFLALISLEKSGMPTSLVDSLALQGPRRARPWQVISWPEIIFYYPTLCGSIYWRICPMAPHMMISTRPSEATPVS
jgi:hypothetical protein